MLKYYSWRTLTLLQSNCFISWKLIPSLSTANIADNSCGQSSFPALIASSSLNWKFCEVHFFTGIFTVINKVIVKQVVTEWIISVFTEIFNNSNCLTSDFERLWSMKVYIPNNLDIVHLA